jgi:hypothetical protein
VSRAELFVIALAMFLYGACLGAALGHLAACQ